MLMVKAGSAVDAVIEQLIPHLEKGDIIVIKGLRFTVLSVKENRVWRLRVSGGALS